MKLVDTDVLINLSRDKLKPSILQWDQSEHISDVSYMEFVQGCRNNEELIRWRKVSERFIVLPITATISQRARDLMEHFSLSHGLTMGDALIAATALSHNLTLMTANKKHFQFIPALDTNFIRLG